jgi:hypothetical protein
VGIVNPVQSGGPASGPEWSAPPFSTTPGAALLEAAGRPIPREYTPAYGVGPDGFDVRLKGAPLHPGALGSARAQSAVSPTGAAARGVPEIV